MSLTWNAASNPFDGGQAGGVCWSDDLGKFVAVGSNGGVSVASSSDGATWTGHGSPFTLGEGVCWASSLGLFVAGARQFGSGVVIATSPDGSVWTPQTTPWDAGAGVFGIAWSETQGLLVAVGAGGAGTAIMTSPDAVNWTEQTSGLDGSFGQGVGYSPTLNMWVAGGTAASVIVTSTNGTAWTTQTSPFDGGQVFAVCWCDGTWLAGGNDSAVTKTLMSSTDGALWTAETTAWDPNGQIRGVAFGGGVAVAVGSDDAFGAGTQFVQQSPNLTSWAGTTSPFTASGYGVAYSPDLDRWVAVGFDTSAIIYTTSVPPGAVPPLWRNFVADLSGAGITDYSKLTSDRAVEVILNGPLSAEGTVPSDNPQVWIPYTDDGYDDPYLSEGTRLMWWFRKESNTPPYYTVRGATIVQLVADEAQQDDARTRFVGWDPWHYMFSRPVQTFTGDLPGDAGISFTATQAATVIESLLDNTFQNDGHIYIDLPDLKPDLTVNSGASGFWSGTIETGPGMEMDIVFQQNTSVGQALQQVCNTGKCDIILNPIYDPTDRPNFLVELNVYAQAGVTRDEAIFAWNAPGRSLVGLSRTEDGSSRANKMVFFAGQGGASGVTAVTQDAASQAKYGVYFAQQFFPGQVDLNAVSDLVDQQLALRRNGKTTVMIRPAPERSPRPWQDYQLGDRVPTWALPQGFRKLMGDVAVGTMTEAQYQRIYGWRANISDDALETVDPLMTSPETGSA